MRILGIDPGSIFCGYGVIERTEDRRQKSEDRGQKTEVRRQRTEIKYISSGRIALPEKKPLHFRLAELYRTLVEIIEEYRPDEVAVEKIFFAKGTKAALSLGHARGVILLSASLKEIPIHEYTALQVKKAVVGYGLADKKQVEMMVMEILRINRALSPDSADALALAICHANTIGQS
ncbi:MAG: crossover junction endodeoxyribonuclease RuvC [Nitrospirales bacterium]|nr:crossover junction endodeoxyribonuclease RuvC [Nitrospirales bacterium]